MEASKPSNNVAVVKTRSDKFMSRNLKIGSREIKANMTQIA